MKHRLTLSIAFVLIVLIAGLIKSDSTVNAQQPQKFVFDTGIIILDNDGETEVARITVATGAGDDAVTIAFRQMTYTENGCNDGVCRQTVSSQNQSAPIVLVPGEALSVAIDPSDPSGNTFVRAVVLSNTPNVKVNAAIINAVTGELITMISAPNQSSKLD
jgi:hypothetical protein